MTTNLHDKMLAAIDLALEALEDFEDVIRYDNEQDDIGARVCCDVLSYNPHTKDCKALKAITALREALAEQPAQPLSDERVSLIAHNIDGGDWNSLSLKESWHEGFGAGFRAAEDEHNIRGKK